MMKLYINSYFILMKTLAIQFGQKMSRGHVEYIYVALVEDINFKILIRVLRVILEGLFIK